MPDTTTIHIPGNGRQELDRASVQIIADDFEPEPITKTYGVLVNGRLYPPRQIVFLAMGLDRSASNPNSQECMEALNRLGYQTFETSAYTESGRILVPEWRERGPNH
ncbi:hypothetical protein [Streptomyces sp. AP-93]|uniref:hypothetical protein n=1 Tax=Streptomyces sp. AP-93 TaxID=2929048 RepID=UPI001FB03067|nr:hypothetical protein [Streptomyces sp. AP-93]MCJ0868114.1 hypothetical protein [Streptomyces sp. AP-93]